MALTRNDLKVAGLTDEQVSFVIEKHTESLEGLKADRDKYKASADRLEAVEKELNTLKEAKADSDGYKKKYEDEHTAFETYKSDVAAKETRAAKEKAVSTYYESKTSQAKIFPLR